MTKTVLYFNLVLLMYFGYEAVTYYSANRFFSDFTTGVVLHDSLVVVTVVVLNTIALVAQAFNIKEKSE